MMEDMLRKAVYLGIGLASVSKQKLEEMVKDFSHASNMGEGEGKKWFDELSAESARIKAKIEEQINARVNEALDKMNVARMQDIERLEARIKALELKMNIYD